MEDQTLADPVEGGNVAPPPGSAAASGPEGFLGSGGSSPGATAKPAATAGRQRKPGRWRRIPRQHVKVTWVPTGSSEFPFAPAFWSPVPAPAPLPRGADDKRQREQLPSKSKPLEVVYGREGSKEVLEARERGNRAMLERAKRLEEEDEDEDEDWCDTEEDKVAYRALKAKFIAVYRRLATTNPKDVVFKDQPRNATELTKYATRSEEHLTAEEMEMEADRSGWLVCPQACHFAMLALEHYNSTEKMHKFEMARVLLSKCFSEADGTTFAHVNFTATSQQSTSHPAKRLFFAELTLIPDLQAYEGIEPMRVLHVCTIDDSCFGGCHEMVRDIKKPLSNDMDYDRCHACSERIKHPRGPIFLAGHNSTRMPYVSVFPLD